MEIGDIIGKYRLVNRIGRGGMGEVWLASASGHGGFSKTVVLKTLLPELASDPLFVEMLAHEARICARLSHPNLVEVFDFTAHGGIYLLAMEYVVGRPLSHIMRAARARNWPIPVWFAMRVVWECCRGLECAHEQGIIHCDLSPSNLMVSFTGVTKILDFGVAHSSEHGPKADRLKGKFPYMAPERINSLATDRRTDVYALGVVLYLMFTGRLPFTADSDSELLMKIVTQVPRPPSCFCPIDPMIEQIILRAMQREPSARHQTIGELLSELSRCLEGQLGTFGQHDAATFVSSLFDSPDVPRQLRETTARGDELSEPPEDYNAYVDSVDIEVESSVLEIWREAPVAARPANLPTNFPMPAGSQTSWPVEPQARPVTRVFAHSVSHEPRTSVQSLFADRPPLSFGHSNVFGAPLFDNRGDPTERVPVVQPSQVDREWDDADREPAPAPGGSPHPTSRGGFGEYSTVRSTAPAHWPWPWPSSRAKSQ
jgi:serine/threonine-protein kinase